MSDLERRLEDLFMADSLTRRVDQLNVRGPGRVPVAALAFLGGVAVITLASIVALSTLRGDSRGDVAAPPVGSASPTVTPTASPTVSPSEASSSIATTAPSPTVHPTTEWSDQRYGIALTLPEPYHVSPFWSKDYAGAHPAMNVMFTTLSSSDEERLSQDCHTACPAKNYAAFVSVYTDAGTATARQWYEAGNIGGSSEAKASDVTVAGHPALKLEPFAYPQAFMYIVPDGQGQMIVLEYDIYSRHPDFAVPAGASEAKLRALVDSLRFTR